MTSSNQDSKASELHSICSLGDSELLQELLSSNLRWENLINQKDLDWQDRTPLQWCCIKGRADMVRVLLEKGAHPGLRTTSGRTAAHFAAEQGRCHILRILHQFNAPMNRVDISGESPKDLAMIYNHKESFEFLEVAEVDYVTRRRKLEASGVATSYDDEDVEWCRHNNYQPVTYITQGSNVMTSVDEMTSQPTRKKKVKKMIQK